MSGGTPWSARGESMRMEIAMVGLRRGNGKVAAPLWEFVWQFSCFLEFVS